LRAARTSFGSLRYIARGLFEGLAAGKSVAWAGRRGADMMDS
jgi:hypothetical protein